MISFCHGFFSKGTVSLLSFIVNNPGLKLFSIVRYTCSSKYKMFSRN